MTELRLKHVSKSFGMVEVLNDINLDIRNGELIVFVGPSGCGKSTLLRMIAGLERISDGVLEIDGKAVNDIAPSERGVAMVFQSYALYPHLTVRGNLAFALELAKMPKAEIRQTVDDVAEKLELTPYLERLPKALSGGQRQRVAIGRAIVRDPRVFLFDEPLSNLDAALRAATRIEIARLKEQLTETIMIYVTHDQIEAMTLASRIVVLNAGKIEQTGKPLELYQRPANEFVARFIGSPAMNLLPGTIASTGDTTGVTLQSGVEIVTDLKTKSDMLGRAVNVGVRPEDMTLATGDDYIYEGRVAITEALGEVTLAYFENAVSTEPVIAKLTGVHAELRNRVVRMSATRDRIHVFADGQSLRE